MTTTTRQRGFTLGETLTALAVVGIGLSLAAPGLQSVTRSNRQAVSVNQLVATLHIARSEAVTRNAPVGVCASSDGTRCDGTAWEQGWIAFLDTDANADHTPSEALVDQVPGLAGMQVRSTEFERALTYRPNGRAVALGNDASTGEFSFCEPGADTAARVVIVRANGLPTLSDKRRDGSTAGCAKS